MNIGSNRTFQKSKWQTREQSSQCLCHLAYKTLAPLKKKFRLDVSSGDVVLLKASHSMNLGSLIEG